MYHIIPSHARRWINRTVTIALYLFGAYVSLGIIIAIPVYRGSERWLTLELERLYPYPAMVINGTVISMSRYRVEVSARQTYADGHNLGSTHQETEQFVIDQLVSRTLFAQELDRHSVTISEGDVEQKLNDIYTQIGGQDKLIVFLHQNYGANVSLDQFRLWIHDSLVEAALRQQLLETATVSHILVAVPEGSNQAAIDAAKQKILGIKAKITSPQQFADIAKQYSDDVASRDKGGSLGVTARGDGSPVFSTDFENAIFTTPLNQVSDPVLSKYGWHIVLVAERQGSIPLSASGLLDKLRSEGTLRIFVHAHN